jgi:hypothetical protein
LKYRGETIAEVWFKPEGEPFGLTFRIPREVFQVPGLGERLTAEKLLKAVGIAAEEVESWRHEGASDPGTNGSDAELGHPLPPPPPGATNLSLSIRLRPPLPAAAPDEAAAPEVPEAKWQHLEARWQAILGLEASIDALRMSMDGLRSQMEAAARKTLTAEEKVHALNADVVQWNKAKSRLHYAVPKVTEFVHRAVWAAGAPERKKLGELFKNHIAPRVPFPEMDRAADHLENLLKDRQVFSAQGMSVYQECKGLVAAVEAALRTLQITAAANATKKRREMAKKGKYF